MDLKTNTTKVSSNEAQSNYLNPRNRGKKVKEDFQKIQSSINKSLAQDGITSLTSVSRGINQPQISYNEYIKREIEGQNRRVSGEKSAQWPSFGFVDDRKGRSRSRERSISPESQEKNEKT